MSYAKIVIIKPQLPNLGVSSIIGKEVRCKMPPSNFVMAVCGLLIGTGFVGGIFGGIVAYATLHESNNYDTAPVPLFDQEWAEGNQ